MSGTKREKLAVVAEAGRLAEEVMAPGAARIDEERQFPTENFRLLGEHGVMGLLVPADAGGGRRRSHRAGASLRAARTRMRVDGNVLFDAQLRRGPHRLQGHA